MFAFALQRFVVGMPRSLSESGGTPCRASAPALPLSELLAGGATQADPSAAVLPAPIKTSDGTASTTNQASPGEPLIQRNAIKDDGARIEETGTRGEPRRITHWPEGPRKLNDEIMPGDGSGSELSRRTAGKRFWSPCFF